MRTTRGFFWLGAATIAAGLMTLLPWWAQAQPPAKPNPRLPADEQAEL